MTRNDDAAPDRDKTSTLGTCPACGNPTTITVLLGPSEGYASPCGCRLGLGSLLRMGSKSESLDDLE